MAATALLAEPDRVRLALSPIRRELLARLREPSSATQLAVALDLSRQRVNYHLRALEEAGLVELVEERPRRGCVERILVARADAFVVDPDVLDGDRDPRPRDHRAAEHLIATATGAVRDVARMQDAAQRAGKRLLTFTVETEVRIAAPADLDRYASALADAVRRVTEEFTAASGAGGRRYRVIAAGHPASADGAAG